MSLTLYTYPNNYRALKSAIVAKYANIDLVVPSADEFKFPEALKTPEFKKLNPVGKVPVLSTPDGPIFESNAILRYLARSAPASNLTGRTFHEQALVDQWLDFAAFELEPPRNLWIYPLQGLMTIDPKASKKAKADVLTNMSILNEHLSTRTYMVGERITIADISLASALVECFRRVFDSAAREKYAHVTRWFRTLINQEFWKSVQGDVKLCEKEEEPANQGKGKKNKGGNKKQQPKKAEKKPEAAPAKPAAKKKNPLDDLPRSSMNLDNVKRIFSNNEFPEALKQFWEQYDAEGFSCHIATYNYNDENTSDFRTANLITGWLQRLESLRKYGFGAANIWGVEDTKGPFYINSAWVFRGADVPEEFSGCPDSEYHSIKKVDLSDATQKQEFENILGSGESFKWGGKDVELFERKYFK